VTDEAIREYLREIGRKGGKARVKKHGVEVLRKMGRKGGKARAERYDKATLSTWAQKSRGTRRRKKNGQ